MEISPELGAEILSELRAIRERLVTLEQRSALGDRSWLTPAEMSQLSGVSPRTLQTYVANGRISATSIKREKRGASFTYRYHRELTMRDIGAA